MLGSTLYSYDFYIFCQSGFYLDFIIKKISEIVVKNLLVYSSLFLGEKYMIEYLTKNIFENFFKKFFKFFGKLNFSYKYFFINLILIFILLYIIVFFFFLFI